MKFSKAIVLLCIGSIIIYTAAALIAFIWVGSEPSTLTYAVYGFFGTELCMLVINRIFGEHDDHSKTKIFPHKTTQPKG